MYRAHQADPLDAAIYLGVLGVCAWAGMVGAMFPWLGQFGPARKAAP